MKTISKTFLQAKQDNDDLKFFLKWEVPVTWILTGLAFVAIAFYFIDKYLIQ